MTFRYTGRFRSVLLLASLTLLVASAAQAQVLQLRGIVRDRNSHRPIPDVNITLAGSSIGTSTATNGSFTLRLENITGDRVLQFRHIGYDVLEVPVDAIKGRREVLLQPRVIPLQSTEISGTRMEGVAARDIPQRVETIEARDFDVRGYVDAGDLLRTDHSVQVEEELSGRKTISMRGGNADEVVVLYDGVKLNSIADNLFDLSLVELSDIERFEIIKGSNTALFGSEAFSGVVNIVSKSERDYSVRAHQQIGTYDAGIWGVQLYQKFGDLAGSYSLRNGGSARAFEDVPTDRLTTATLHHHARLSYRFGESASPAYGTFHSHWRYASVDYENNRDAEQLLSTSHVGGMRYEGDIGPLSDLRLSAAVRTMDQEAQLRVADWSLFRHIEERGLQAGIEKTLPLDDYDFTFAYQYAHGEIDLFDDRRNMLEQPLGIESGILTRQQHGLIAIGKAHGETGSEFFRTFDFDISLRHDIVQDSQDKTVLRPGSTGAGLLADHDWSNTLFKFAVHLTGMKDDFLLDVFLSYGSNMKYPTLLQQISVPSLVDAEAPVIALEPENNRSVELGASLTREIAHGTITGWELTGTFFQNNYSNKFRPITTVGVPVTLYDNVDNAQISGLEGTAGVYLFEKKVLAEIGLSRYFISEQSAFPFKSDMKRTLSLKVDHAGYALHLFHFSESEQIGLLRTADGGFVEVELPRFSNLDVHFSKYLPVASFQFFVNVSLRNLLETDETVLSGLAIRDRRYYITVGMQI